MVLPFFEFFESKEDLDAALVEDPEAGFHSQIEDVLNDPDELGVTATRPVCEIDSEYRARVDLTPSRWLAPVVERGSYGARAGLDETIRHGW